MIEVHMVEACLICGREDSDHRWVSREELVTWSRSQTLGNIEGWCTYLKPLYMIPLSPPDNPCDQEFMEDISS
jgi:hypothetical protein